MFYLCARAGAVTSFTVAAPRLLTLAALSSLTLIAQLEETLMLEGLFQPMHLLVIFGIALLVFGPKKLPELGKGIGEGIRGFKSAIKEHETSDSADTNILPASKV